MRPVLDDDLDVPPGYRNASEKFREQRELTARAAELAATIVEDPQYLDQLLTRARAGTLPPAIEKMLWEYRYGRPMEMSKMKGKDVDPNGLAELSLEELSELARKNAEDAQLLLKARAEKVGVSVLPGRRM